MLKTGFRNLLHHLPDLLIGPHPLPNETLQGLGNMDHLPFSPDPQSQIKTRVQLAAGTFASGFAADAGHGDQGPEEERLFVQKLGQTGAETPPITL